jgi:ribonucleoside-diphosphate reductase beta chain
MPTLTHTVKTPRELYQIAKHLGTWDPADMSLEQDRADFESLGHDEKEQITKICALFYEGEVSVADTLAWFMLAMPEPDRRMYLSTHVFEEVKHAEFFERYFKEVLGEMDTASFIVPESKNMLMDGLQERGEAMGQALINRDREGLDRALTMFAAHYMGIVEGVMAQTAYDYVGEMLTSVRMFPKLQEAIRLIRSDEGRHIIHGMDYLRKQIAEHPEHKAPVKELFLDNIKSMTLWTQWVFDPNPFGLSQDRMMTLGYNLHRQRMRDIGLIQ